MSPKDHSIQKLTIWSHGSPGVLDFRGDSLDVGAVWRLDGKGFADLFADDARIVVDGCKAGDTAAGRDFVKALARVFLSKAGGRVSARSGYALSVPTLTDKVFSIGGLDVHARIKKGASKATIALGHEVSGLGAGKWYVTCNGKKCTYWFEPDHSVKWWEGVLSFSPGKGTWKLAGDILQMDWESGSVERWDLPLFNDEESGVLTTKGGDNLDVTAVESD
jgi:hypothetical protein